jgi:hypothetical protein
MRSLIIVCLLAVSHPALADDTASRLAAIKTMFDAQTKSFQTLDDEAFKATLTSDALVAFGSNYPRDDYGSWNLVRAQKVVIVASKSGWAGTWGWIAAELRITYTWYAEPEGAGDPHPKPETHTYRFVALVVPDGAGVKAKVLRMAQTTPDKELSASNHAQDLLPIASPPANVALLAQPNAIVALLAKDPATSVLGTSDAERGFGAAAAKRLVARWSKLTLEVVDTPDEHEKLSYKPVELTVGEGAIAWAKLRMKLPGKPTWYPIDAFGVFRKVGDHSEIVALMYTAH